MSYLSFKAQCAFTLLLASSFGTSAPAILLLRLEYNVSALTPLLYDG
jgi:hypothetical protein